MNKELTDDRKTQKPARSKTRSSTAKTRASSLNQQSPTPGSTPASSPTKLCNSSSEEDLDNECDKDGITFVHFNVLYYASGMKQEFYAVDYIDTYYIGCIINLTKNKVTCKFLSRQPNDECKRPARDDIADIEPKWIFTGPLKLSGTVSFTIRRLQNAHKSYRNYLKNKEC